MAFHTDDRVKETSNNAAGTGAFVLGGAMTGFRSFASVLQTGDTFHYTVQEVDANGNPTGAWETGYGTYTTATNSVARNTVWSSSNSNAIISFSNNPKQIWIDAPAISLPSRRRPQRIVVFGDSLISGSTAFTSGVWQFGNGFAELSVYRAGPQYQLVANAGVAGNTTTQMLARIYTDVMAYSPDVVYLLAGTNDFTLAMTNLKKQTMMNNIEKMVRIFLKAGVEVFLMSPPPNNTNFQAAKDCQFFYYDLAQYYNLPFADMYRMTVDPNTNGQFLSGYTADGTHPSNTASDIFASEVGAVLGDIQNSTSQPYMASVSETAVNNYANLIRNGTFSNQTSPPAPDGWTINSSNGNYTTAAASYPYTGKTFKYTSTASGGKFILSGGIVTAGYAAGDTMLFSGHIQTSGLLPASSSGFTVSLDMTGTGTPHMRPMVSNPFNSDFVFAHTFPMPAAITAIVPTVFVQDAAVYRVNNLTLFNISTARAIWQPGQLTS